jgi:hypothetical protein
MEPCDDAYEDIKRLMEERDSALFSLQCAAMDLNDLEQKYKKLQTAMRNIKPYLEWTIGVESPGYHPTMPSAVASFIDVMKETE